MRPPRTPSAVIAPRGIVPDIWFEFIVGWTLRRAYRRHEHLALITVRAIREFDGSNAPPGSPELAAIADVIAPTIRDVDLIGECAGGLCILCLDIDEQTTELFAERIADAIEGVRLAAATTFEIGTTAFPSHGSDLKRLAAHAASHPAASVAVGPARSPANTAARASAS